MTKKEEVYKCEICGNVVKVVEEGVGTLVCCGQDMKLLSEKTSDEGLNEKHVPVIEKKEKSVIVRVGSIEHPMTKEHYIKWIEVNADGSVYVVKLNPGDAPMAEFKVKGKKISARSLCNIHGLWKSDIVS